MTKYKTEQQKLGCGIFQRWRKPPSSLPSVPPNTTKTHRIISVVPVSQKDQNFTKIPVTRQKPISRKASNHTRNSNLSKFGSGGGIMGNILVRQHSEELDPEVLKKTGNECYLQGRFKEALGYYEKAICLDPKKAVYRCNKSAALICLGRVFEAVTECREALRLEPCYGRAHHRLARLYVRLGIADKALCHYKEASRFIDDSEVEQAQELRKCLLRCYEARISKDWVTLMKETQFAISSGADCAYLVYALQAEALLKLNRHQEAYLAYQKGQIVSVESLRKLFDLSVCSYIFMIRALIFIAAGRFDDAVNLAQQATKLDPSSKEANTILKRVKTVASARLSGNLLFKAERYKQACILYSEGLVHDPYNSVLLCNRAACRLKLGQLEKAIQDCTAALNLMPSYSKARQRKAECNAKLENWEAVVQDYEVLIREGGGSKEVNKSLLEAKMQIKDVNLFI